MWGLARATAKLRPSRREKPRSRAPAPAADPSALPLTWSVRPASKPGDSPAVTPRQVLEERVSDLSLPCAPRSTEVHSPLANRDCGTPCRGPQRRTRGRRGSSLAVVERRVATSLSSAADLVTIPLSPMNGSSRVPRQCFPSTPPAAPRWSGMLERQKTRRRRCKRHLLVMAPSEPVEAEGLTLTSGANHRNLSIPRNLRLAAVCHEREIGTNGACKLEPRPSPLEGHPLRAQTVARRQGVLGRMAHLPMTLRKNPVEAAAKTKVSIDRQARRRRRRLAVRVRKRPAQRQRETCVSG